MEILVCNSVKIPLFLQGIVKNPDYFQEPSLRPGCPPVVLALFVLAVISNHVDPISFLVRPPPLTNKGSPVSWKIWKIDHPGLVRMKIISSLQSLSLLFSLLLLPGGLLSLWLRQLFPIIPWYSSWLNRSCVGPRLTEDLSTLIVIVGSRMKMIK